MYGICIKIIRLCTYECSHVPRNFNHTQEAEQWIFGKHLPVSLKFLLACRRRWGTAVMRGKAVSCHSRKTKNAKIKLLFYQQLQVTSKLTGTKNLQYGLSWFDDIYWYSFYLTIQQHNKCLAMFSEKNIMQFLHSEIVRYKCNYWSSFIF